MTRFYKKFFTSNLRIWSSFYIFFLLIFIFFWNFKTMNSISTIFKFEPARIRRILIKCAKFVNPVPVPHFVLGTQYLFLRTDPCQGSIRLPRLVSRPKIGFCRQELIRPARFSTGSRSDFQSVDSPSLTQFHAGGLALPWFEFPSCSRASVPVSLFRQGVERATRSCCRCSARFLCPIWFLFFLQPSPPVCGRSPVRLLFCLAGRVARTDSALPGPFFVFAAGCFDRPWALLPVWYSSSA
jgi:hypothetical protein